MALKPPPAAFAKLRAEQDEKKRQQNAAEEAERRYLQQELDAKSERLWKALLPYDCVELDGHLVHVTRDPNTKEVFFDVDEKRYLTLRIIRVWDDCHCENVCSCPKSSSLEIDARRIERGLRCESPFMRADSLGDDNAVAAAVAEEMDLYDYAIGKRDTRWKR